MTTPFEPTVGQWYQDDDRRIFEVVAWDLDAIEIQYYDGDVDEFDMDVWYMMDIIPADEPNDGSGPFDELDSEELSHIQNSYSPASWQYH